MQEWGVIWLAVQLKYQSFPRTVDWPLSSEWFALNVTHSACLYLGTSGSGRSSLPAALCPLGLLPCPSEAGGPHLSTAAGLRLAAGPSVSPGSGAGGATAAAAGPGGLCLRLWDLPLQQRAGTVRGLWVITVITDFGLHFYYLFVHKHLN